VPVAVPAALSVTRKRQMESRNRGAKPRNDLDELLAELTALRNRVATDGSMVYRAWRSCIERREFRPSAMNFAHYLDLRREDLRPLQRRLMAFGLSSLGRAEGRVLATLDAVTIALCALARKPARKEIRAPLPKKFFRGERILSQNCEVLFGSQEAGRGRILVTLDTQAANDPEFILQLAQKGADALRINCAHDDHDVWSRMVENLRHAERKIGRKIPLLIDIAGPKVRVAEVVTPADNRLRIGDDILLSRDLVPNVGDIAFQVRCEPREILDDVTIGDRVAIDDGKLSGPIIRRTHDGLVARMEKGRLKGVKLKPQKGLNFPGVALKLDPLTPQDLIDLDFVIQNADMVGYSFVQSADHVVQLQRELAARRTDWRKLALVAKIETPQSVHNLPQIIVQTAGRQPLAIMIARGDLGVEIGFTRLAEMQEEILWLCEAAHIPAIWATQVLEGLVTKGLASRGEMTDAAMAGRAECVMLNKGANVMAAVEMLDRLMRRMAEHQVKKTPTLRALHSWSEELTINCRLP